jgi:hypothetical protein
MDVDKLYIAVKSDRFMSMELKMRVEWSMYQ